MNSTAGRLLFSLRSNPLVCLPLCLLLAFSGCRICQDCGDLDYPTYGGAWERTRRDSGRVGSIFDPAGARSATLSDREPAADDPTNGPPENADRQAPGEVTPEPRPDSDDKADSDPSPSDRPQPSAPGGESGTLRELDLEDINVERRDIMPPQTL